MRIRFRMQYKFLHIQMVVSFGTIISHWRGLYCHSIDRCLYLRTHIIALLCHLVTTVGECKLWTMASEIQLNTCIQLHTTVWKYSCNNTHHHQWPCYSLLVQAVNVFTTDNSSMHRVWIASREKTFVDSAPSQGGQLCFSTCQRKTTVHRIAQQVLSHWVKWSNSHNRSHKHAAE